MNINIPKSFKKSNRLKKNLNEITISYNVSYDVTLK